MLAGVTNLSALSWLVASSYDAADRQQAVRTFRDNPSVRIALLSVTAAGVGLDFSAASHVVFAELPSEVSFVRQAEDRAHRRGQQQPVNVYFLLAKGTTDERCWQVGSDSCSAWMPGSCLASNCWLAAALHAGAQPLPGTRVSGARWRRPSQTGQCGWRCRERGCGTVPGMPGGGPRG